MNYLSVYPKFQELGARGGVNVKQSASVNGLDKMCCRLNWLLYTYLLNAAESFLRR